MSYQNQKPDVQSLLELLQQSQSPQPQPYPPNPEIPSKRQLDELLSSLSTSALPSAAPTSSAFAGSRRNLIEPFGPVGQVSSSKPNFDPQIFGSVEAGPSRLPAPTYHSSEDVPKIRDRRNEEGWGEMKFSQALPVLTELMRDEGVKRELRKMKADQDTLERRLWAKRERLKAEAAKQLQAEEDIGKIARRPVTLEKKARIADALTASLEEFFHHTCFPAIDGLALRQRQRLGDLGVPGLAGSADDPKAQVRVKRVLDVLEAMMEE